MSFINLVKWALLSTAITATLSCTEKVETGSVLKDFSGVAGVEPLSPTAVRVYWNLHDRYQNYKVFNNTSNTALVETPRNEAIIRNLSPNTSYTFKVIATDGTVSVGGNKEITISTLTPFPGVDKVIKDSDGNLVLSWNYAAKVASYQIFVKKYEDPTAANTSNWANVDYTSYDTRYVFRNMEGSTRFHFVVQVKYLDETIGYATKAVNVSTNSSFPTPAFSLSPISIGSLPFVKVTPVVNSTYKNENYVSRMYSGSTPISDPITGAGTIVFSPGTGVTNGKVENLSLQVSYSDAGKTETLVFDKLSTYIKGILGLDAVPPLKNVDSGIAFMGEASTTGDFNCDGYPDLAVGLPSVSVTSAGVAVPRAGAVYIYYSVRNPSTGIYKLNTSGTPSRSPISPGSDPQLLTFEDLTEYSRFGKSLSGSGNLNGDTLLGNACQDLVVGAPGYNTANTSRADKNYDGAAFVFFGSSRGLTAPSRVKDMQQNVETCNGLVENATCSAAMLWPNMAILPSTEITPTAMTLADDPQFGFAASFIGDFNADGYDDIAVGAPTAPWDGVADSTASGNARIVLKVGYVAVFFGSKNGLGYETPAADANKKFRFLKVFSPNPHEGQFFGYSIAGGADVDGKFRIRNKQDQLVGGSDMIVGAPGDRYPQMTATNKLKLLGACNPGSGDCASYGFTNGGWGGFSNDSTGNSHYFGLPTNAGTSAKVGDVTGAAYLFFGRGADIAPAPGVQESPSRMAFWGCSTRKMSVPGEHYSCLVNSTGVRALFPRSGYKTDGTYKLKNLGFGTSVALVGDPSHYNNNNAVITTVSDPNGDSYAEAVVGVGLFSNFANEQSGALWVYYGNPFRRYEFNDFYQLDAVTPTDKNLDWNDGLAQCTAFTTDNAPTRQMCAPTLIRSNSIGSYYNLALHPEGMAVGDVTGDGLKDVVVGAVGDQTKGTYSGAVYAFTSLAGAGITTNFLKFYNSSAREYDYMGRSVAVGNFDGDFSGTRPLNDIAAGAHLDKTTKNGGGAIYGFNSNGQALPSVNSVPSFAIYDSLGSPQQFGYDSIRIVGDINRDGYADAVGKLVRPSANTAAFSTEAVVFFGSKVGLVTTDYCLANKAKVFKDSGASDDSCYPMVTPAQGITKDDIALPQLVAQPTNISSTWANRAFAAGDINGDGFGDVTFVDATIQGGGQVVIYYGSRSGLQAVNNPQWIPAYGDPQIVTKRWAYQESPSNTASSTNGAVTRRQLVYHGDFNGDGLSDIVISSPYATSFFGMNKTGTNSFNVGVSPPGNPTDGWTAGGGWQCADSTDTGCNGGAPAWESGRIWIYYGSTNGLQTPKAKGYANSDMEPGVNANLTSTNSSYMVDTYTSETTGMKACTGAITKNCKMQYLYSPFVDNIPHGYDRLMHQFGKSIAVMDYDHDGIDDLVVSAPMWEDTACYYEDGRSDYGRLFLYRGSSAGIVAGSHGDYYDRDPIQTASCQSDDLFQSRNADSLNLNGTGKVRSIMPPIINGGLSGNDSNRRFGWMIQSAGDVNNDGYEDLIVSSSETPKSGLDGAGMGYIFYGPLCGNDNSTGMWSVLGANLNTQYKLTDAAIVASGVIPMAECAQASGVMKPAPMAFYLWDAGNTDFSGYEIISGRMKKGDFNGDGFDDVVMGAPFWDDQVNGITNFGRGVVFFGSSTGLHTADYPDSSVVADSSGHLKPYIVQRQDTSTQTPRYFYSNTSAGDVNGDGTMDLMVPTEFYDGAGSVRGVRIGTYFLLF
ncbi:hypothetical protein [Bdellovibrio sp. HCB288]|uniref:hypothetical protein n=1 Tax=Bdellovibrio sp. HCB288 TaxID=3394355 RepID=UPI0039B4E9E6